MTHTPHKRRTFTRIGRRFGRTYIQFERIPGHLPRRFGRRSGGSRTPGPWWELSIPLVGSFLLNRDRTLFGWTDPTNGTQ